MATKKDLVEAYSFSRRRLVTAFVSGAPGGREVEPSRPGRTLIGGVALAVLVAAGGAVAGILGSHESVDWTKPALVSDKDSFAVYVVLPTDDDAAAAGVTGATDATGSVTDDGNTDAEAVLRPVANITSAMLLLGPDLDHEVVSGSEIATQHRGAPIGIQQAPPTPPAADSLIQTGWTACAGTPGGPTVGVRLNLSTAPTTTPVAPGGVMLLHAAGTYYLAAEVARSDGTSEAYVYRVPKGPDPEGLLQDLAGVRTGDAVETTPEFISLFHRGPALDASSFVLTAASLDTPFTPAAPDLDGTPHLGDTYRVRGGDGQTRVLLPGGAARLDPFAAAVYRNAFGAQVHDYGVVSPDEPKGSEDPAYDSTVWPSESVPMQQVGAENCVVLDTTQGEPRVHLATSPLPAASAADVPAGQHLASVDTGHGAVVQSGAFADADFDPTNATPFLVDDRGYAYQLDAGAGAQLGYADVPAVDVPDAWRKLLTPGVPLSVDAARCPPTVDQDDASCAG